MCLPISCLKLTVSLQAWVIVLLGIAATAGAIATTILASSIDAQFESVGFYPGKGLIAFSWILAVCLLIIGLSGVIGANKQNRCLLSIFNIGNICGFLAFISLGITAFMVGSGFINFQSENCIEQTWSANLENLYMDSEIYFCQQQCQCYISNTQNVNASGLFYSSQMNSLPYQFQQCSQYQTYQDQYSNTNDLANLLSYLENSMDCSGWCTPYQIYVFSNVNDGIPNNQACYEASFEQLKKSANVVGYASTTIGIVIGFFLMFSICLCCHPKKLELEEEQAQQTQLAQFSKESG